MDLLELECNGLSRIRYDLDTNLEIPFLVS